MKKTLTSVIVAIAMLLALPATAFAHVIVTPGQAGVGASTMFNVSVPNEKEVAVTSVKLDIPGGVQNVQPNVLAGWDITTTKDRSGNVSSITWTGSIPVGQRADLAFKAQTPANAGNLDWKAYQTYADGSIVHWDQNPSTHGKAVKDDVGPYSITKVINDVNPTGNAPSPSGTSQANLALVLSIAALVLSIGGILLRRRT